MQNTQMTVEKLGQRAGVSGRTFVRSAGKETLAETVEREQLRRGALIAGFLGQGLLDVWGEGEGQRHGLIILLHTDSVVN